MVRRAFVVLAGCSFSSPNNITDDAAIDDDAGSDAAVPCNVSASGAGTDTTSLGGTGGSVRPDLVCAGGELPIGVSFESTLNPRPEGGNGSAGERVVTAIHVRCGGIARRSDGTLAVTPDETTEWISNECGWGPYVSAPEVRCPADTVLVGLFGNGGSFSLFNTVSITCAPLTGGAVQSVAVVDTGSYTNKPELATCQPGSAVVSFGIRGDCGVDQVTPRCAALQCQ